MAQDTQVYFVNRPFFQEALLTLSFRQHVNWLEEGMSIVSWEYTRVASLDEVEMSDILAVVRQWDGNEMTHLAGHRCITVGDVVVVGDNAWILTGSGCCLIPESLWKKVKRNPAD